MKKGKRIFPKMGTIPELGVGSGTDSQPQKYNPNNVNCFISRIGKKEVWDSLVEHANRDDVEKLATEIAKVINKDDYRAVDIAVALFAVLWKLFDMCYGEAMKNE
jgi:hypothetical protein